LDGQDGSPVTLQDNLDRLIIAAAASRLSANGIGLFVVPPSFFFSGRSALRSFPALGLGIETALLLPAGSFAPYTNIPTYVISVRKHECSRPGIHLGDLATAINLGRPGDAFEFPQHPNAIFVPMIGISDVIVSFDELALKRQDYVQVALGNW
jgi:hypothetical protein